MGAAEVRARELCVYLTVREQYVDEAIRGEKPVGSRRTTAEARHRPTLGRRAGIRAGQELPIGTPPHKLNIQVHLDPPATIDR